MQKQLIPLLLFILHSVCFGFSGGDGTVEAPYQISTPQELDSVRYFHSTHFELINDIDLNTPPFNEGEGWEPISGATGYVTTFNGNGFTIQNLYIDRPEISNLGLFKSLKNATIQNLNLASCTINGKWNIGSIVGSTEESLLQNCSVSGSVKGQMEVGGIVGRLYSGSTKSCEFNGSVIGEASTGGISGSNRGVIDSCTATLSIDSSKESLGGIVGHNFGKINNCRTAGSISGTNNVGGIFGLNNDTVTNCTSEARITGNSTIGGIGGYNNDTISYIYSCHASGEIVCKASTAGGLLGVTGGRVDSSSATGNVSASSLAGGLIGTTVNVVSNCYATGTVRLTGGKQAVGAGGLIGAVNNSSGFIQNSYARGSVYGYSSIGGLVGSNSGTVNNCYSTGNLYGTMHIGGLTGYFYGGLISNSYSISDINGGDFSSSGLTGYLVGHNPNSKTVRDCFYNYELASPPFPGEGTSLSTDSMMMQAPFGNAGWDFNATWEIKENETFPGLKKINDAPFIIKKPLTKQGFLSSDTTLPIHISDVDGTVALSLAESSGTNNYSINTSDVNVIVDSLWQTVDTLYISAIDELGNVGIEIYTFIYGTVPNVQAIAKGQETILWNPTKRELILQNTNKAKVSLVSLDGKKIFNRELIANSTGGILLSLVQETLASGIYILRIEKQLKQTAIPIAIK